MAQEKTFRDVQVRSSEIGIRTIRLDDLWQSLKEGYDDFGAMPTLGMFLTVIFYLLFALLLTLFLVGKNLLQLAFPIVAGLTLIGPVVSVGLVEMSRRRERGLDVGWRSTFDFVHSSSFAPILALSVVMTLLYVAWLFMAQFLYFGLFGADPPVSASDFVTQLATRRGAALIVYGILLGFLFALTALAISVVAFPLLLDKPASAATAVAVSIRAVVSNLMVMAVWGVIVVVLLAAGAIVFLIGLAAVLPILGHATWHLYRKVVEP